MRYGIVDVGSNSIRLCAYDVSEEDGSFTRVFDKKHMAGLAGYVDKNRRMTLQGVTRAVVCIQSHLERCAMLEIPESNIFVFATASIRNINNSADVVSSIEQICGCKIDLLSAEEEADLGFQGAIRSIGATDGVLLDIGGGSSEVSLFENSKVKCSCSIPQGSLSMFMGKVENLFPTDDEIASIRKDIRKQADEIKGFKGKRFDTIYAIGGSARAAMKLSKELFAVDRESTTTATAHLEKMLETASDGKKETLLRILAVAPERVHTLFPGMAIEAELAGYFSAKQVEVLRYGIREGYLCERVLGR